MLKKDFILCKTRNLLTEFIKPITEKVGKPKQKFLRQAVAAILLSGSLIVTEFANVVHIVHSAANPTRQSSNRQLSHVTWITHY